MCNKSTSQAYYLQKGGYSPHINMYRSGRRVFHMSNKCLLTAFWNCGDNQIIEFALIRAHLNAQEKQVITLMLDECMTQEQIAERLDFSTRKVQEVWGTGAEKLLRIPWVLAYANELNKK